MATDIAAEIASIMAQAMEPTRAQKIEAIELISKALNLHHVVQLHIKSQGDDGSYGNVNDEDLDELFQIARTWANMNSRRRPDRPKDQSGVVVEFRHPSDR